ncbi:MAG: hypothetical protein ABS79_00130 [Planctomycetes bacterium SCN 63-9]|nr:MAG: hypothetical protein ABS79_00130 [Planctomycetes bacterium SCN 63-9]
MPQTSNKAASLMRWYIRFTRFATSHLVRLQENEASCGPSCVMMVHCRMNRLTTITDGMATEQGMVQNVRTLVPGQGGWDPANDATSGDDVVALLNSFGIGTWQCDYVTPGGLSGALRDQASFFNLSTVPAIVHVDWGHWVMVDYMFGEYAVICDPWDAHVHVTKVANGQAVPYNNRTPALSWSIPPVWKTRKGGGNGALSGWIIRCTGMDVKSRLGKVFLGNGV